MTKSCTDCIHSRSVEQGTKTSCAWEKHVYPPPVFRERFWGKNAPLTWDSAAEDCHHYSDKRLPSAPHFAIQETTHD